MPLASSARPEWLTFDCYGTLIDWDDGLRKSAARVIEARRAEIDPAAFVEPYDQHESELEQPPFRPFREVAPAAFRAALGALGVEASEADGRSLLDAIPEFVPFAETLDTLAELKAGGLRIAIISNTDDDLIAGNVAQLGGRVDRVVTAEQARAYKPSRLIFEQALSALGIGYDRMVHVCASPGIDHAAARDLHFRCVWIDRGTYRKTLADYTADETLPTLAGLPDLFARLGWMANRRG